MTLNLVQTLSELVAIPSVNPMGQPVSGPEYFEYRVTDYLERLFQGLGLPYERHTVAERRDNIIARIEGDVPPTEGGLLLLFEAHQDTVPVTGMTIEPWKPAVRDGRMYGRGACDIKGGMTAMLGAIARLASERPKGMPTIVMACTVNEEHGFTGATALSKTWSGGSAILPRQPDAAVVAEPTSLNVVVAHKGVVRWKCHTRGRAGHSSQPHLGENAIYKMAAVLKSLERYACDVVPRLGNHPRCGSPTLSVGTITGGLSVNTVPDQCTIEIDRRLLPGEEPAEAQRHVVDYVAAALAGVKGIEHDPALMVARGLSDQFNGPLANGFLSALREATGRGETIGVPYGTDAAVFSAAGVPSIVFGPGSIDQAHTADEWLPLDELEQASEALYLFGRAGEMGTAARATR